MRSWCDLLFVDVDGTLVGHDDKLSPGVCEAMRDAKAAGCETVICTGRSMYTARVVAKAVGADRVAVVLNGAVVVDWQTGATLRRETLDPSMVADAVTLMKGAGLAALCFGVEEDDRVIYAERDGWLPDLYIEWNAKRLAYREDVAASIVGPPVMVSAYGPPERTRPVARALSEKYGAKAAIIESAAPRYDCWCVEVHSPRAGKCAGAEVVARYRGVPRERTCAIGDHLNDVEMIRWAGVGIAMGDGRPEAKQAADYVTATLDDDGVARAIRRYVLCDVPPGSVCS